MGSLLAILFGLAMVSVRHYLAHQAGYLIDYAADQISAPLGLISV
jgi:hypothetical protein